MLDKAYNPQNSESTIYETWEASGFFNPDKLPGRRTKSFVISMPPPNVTGELHLGHATGIAIQDALIRFERMRGKRALWVPGTDHAGIATQIMVERLIAQQGLNRHKLGREKFLERVWQWKEQYGSSITNQIRSLGASCDWSREAFTMDKERSLAVRTAFKKLYDDKLIYRGKRIISWCPRCLSAISDLEVKHVETNGKLYTIRYQLAGTTKFVTVATTRPETMLGDTALAVHPLDERYKEYVGKTAIIPIIEREIPIIADPAVEKDFGTGVVKVTPAHDPVDFDIGMRHKLPAVVVIDENATMTKGAGVFYGKHVQDARQEVLRQLQETGHLESTVDYIHNVAHCDRCGTTIEPLLSEQWFVSVKPLARKALAAVREKKIRIVPERYTKVYRHWLTNIHDWTISRQLWWGHQIPVWYCEDCGNKKPIVSIETPNKCPTCGSKKLKQEPDTLDTWFSSGLWTFSTLGWPLKTKDLKRFHPTDVLETGWDILFFWVVRMAMMSLYLTKQVPFRTVYLHGLVLDKDGRKMSKSKGTGIDPLPMAKKFGTDAIRLSLILNTTPGQDFRLSEEKISHYRNFINKLWNVGRFVENMGDSKEPMRPRSLADRWILSKLASVTKQTTERLATYHVAEAGEGLYAFLWHEFADWYLEIAKTEKNIPVLRYVFKNLLVLLHPFAPFVTEELWASVAKEKTLCMIQPWPKPGKRSAKEEKIFAKLQSVIVAIRTVRNITKTPHSAKLQVAAVGTFAKTLLEQQAVVSSLATVASITKSSVKKPTLVIPGCALDLHLGDSATHLLQEEIDRLRGHEKRLKELLQKPSFKERAPKEIVAQNQQKLDDIVDQLKHLGA